jgi:hypothetical protein
LTDKTADTGSEIKFVGTPDSRGHVEIQTWKFWKIRHSKGFWKKICVLRSQGFPSKSRPKFVPLWKSLGMAKLPPRGSELSADGFVLGKTRNGLEMEYRNNAILPKLFYGVVCAQNSDFEQRAVDHNWVFLCREHGVLLIPE